MKQITMFDEIQPVPKVINEIDKRIKEKYSKKEGMKMTFNQKWTLARLECQYLIKIKWNEIFSSNNQMIVASEKISTIYEAIDKGIVKRRPNVTINGNMVRKRLENVSSRYSK